MSPEKLSELGGLSELSVPELTDLYCIVTKFPRFCVTF